MKAIVSRNNNKFSKTLKIFFITMSTLWIYSVNSEQISVMTEILPLEGPEALDGVKLLSVAVGSYPEHLGSDDYKIGLAPSLRFESKNSSRYIQLVGPELVLNIVNSDTWSFGPAFNYRFGRDGNKTFVGVDGMQRIDDTVEIGAFIGWRKVDSNEFRNRFSARLQFLSDTGNVHKGYIVNASAQVMRRIALPVDLFLSGAMSYADNNYMQTYFGIDDKNMGVSDFPLYQPNSGLRDVRLSFGTLIHFSRSWHIAVGGQYQRLLRHAANSPIVKFEGSRNQWVSGIAVVYAWE